MPDKFDELLEDGGRARAARRARQAQEARAERERVVAKARAVLGTPPPPLPVSARRLAKVFEAPPPAGAREGQTATIEGLVFDACEVESGHMGGGDNFVAFDMISADDHVTSWRYDYPDVHVGKAVRIKCVAPDGRVDGYDHCFDTILEVWTERP